MLSPPESPFSPATASVPGTPTMMPLTMPYYPGAPWLPHYEGESHSLPEFRDKLLATLALYPFTEEQKVGILTGQLKGPALREVKSWPREQCQNVVQILDRLRNTFDKCDCLR
ncbi:hypothetical protein GDO81_010868 [Engystomops pustulosus]|uniref:Uncharacterized protein n=1 Tax=Engystomops pustulosus TaxID=76066 RepID=A0AAV7C361_ENGPU|nr:hypothetical protein GDO81_010868 [Engystomops pustulosus]